MTVLYNPSDHFEFKVWDVEFRRDPVRTLMARIYQPQGNRPFPALLDVHGGAWNTGDRMSNKDIDERLAASGILTMAIDLRLAHEAPYPASIADAHYGIRWLKAKAREWNGNPATVGVLGSSSGGYVVELIAMRPDDPQYNSIPLNEASGIDATMSYVVTRSPVSDPFVRYLHAEKMDREEMIQRTKRYFDPWDSITQGNPQRSSTVARREYCRPSLCFKAEPMITSSQSCRKNSWTPIDRPAANATSRSFQAASINGCASPDPKPTVP